MTVNRHLPIVGAVACIPLLFLASALTLAQSAANQGARSDKKTDEGDEVTLDGCLYGGQGNFELVNADDSFELRGDVSALNKYMGDEVQVRGKQEGSDHRLSIVVSGVKMVFKAPQVELSKTISDPSKWHFQTNELYGIRFALPAFAENATGGGSVSPNFVAETGTVTLSELPIRREIYPSTGFVGGNFLLSANPELNNRESCEKFGASEPRFISQSTFGGVQYTKLTVRDAAMGTSYEELYFHTFRNGVCYEVAFSLGETNTANQDFGCRVPRHGDTNEVVQQFMRRITYLPPAIARSAGNPGTAPRVTSFTASPTTVSGGNDRGVAELSWTTEGADYIELSYHCSNFALGVVIAEQGGAGGRNCENDPKPITPQTQQLNHPPNSGVEVSLANFDQEDPISIVVTITPFSHGAAYSGARKSITISVAPFNPFPKGIPSATANITLTYAGGPKDAYEQGTSLTVNWTDTLSRDSCVNLLLARDSSNGIDYVGRVSQKCLAPAAAGTYTWTIPGRYSGRGFRLYVAAPGQESSALGPVFSIVKTAPQDHLRK